MYFPDPHFLAFIKSVNQTVKSVANEEGTKQHGKHIIEIATESEVMINSESSSHMH